MENNKDQNGFFDKNTLLAIGLSFAVFFGWQTYMNKKFPKKKAVQQEQMKESATVSNNVSTSDKSNPTVNSSNVAPDELSNNSKFAEELLPIEFNNASYVISSKGMGFHKISLKNYSGRDGNPIQFGGETGAVATTTLMGEALNFSLKKVSENVVEGLASVANKKIKKVLTFNSNNYVIKTELFITSQSASQISVSTVFKQSIKETSSSFLTPTYAITDFFHITNETNDRKTIKFGDSVENSVENVIISTLNTQYFSQSFINKSDVFPFLVESMKQDVAKAELTYKSLSNTKEFNISYDFYFGPKDLNVLSSVDKKLEKVIDYGFFSFIGIPLLKTLKFIQKFVGNWGLAIILLTILLRTLLLPLNIYSSKSMKKMQKIQPQIKQIKEKYKDDPMKTNQETMMLMKSEGANPLSGCLPAIAQIPIFFAFFSVLGKSIELYQAPFFFWIQDLSAKDPFFIFPVLVGALFFIQQKLTPTPNMDPAQKKVMQFVPLIFCVFMISMPSGLTLYMVVSSLFAIIQQYFVIRQTT